MLLHRINLLGRNLACKNAKLLGSMLLCGTLLVINTYADSEKISEKQLTEMVSQHCGYKTKNKFIENMMELKKKDIAENQHVMSTFRSDMLLEIYYNLAKEDMKTYILILKAYMKNYFSYEQISFAAKNSYPLAINLDWLKIYEIQFGLSGSDCNTVPY